MSNAELIERLRTRLRFKDNHEAATAIELADKWIAELEAELKQRAKQIGVACMRHDLTHSLACGRCLAEAELLLQASVKRGGELIGEKEEAERKLAVAREALKHYTHNTQTKRNWQGAIVEIKDTGGPAREALAQIGGEDAGS